MKKFCVLVMVVLVAGLTKADKFVYPTDLKRCPYSDSECLLPTAGIYLKKGANGIKGINLSPIDPFEIKEISVEQGKNRPVNVKLNITNSILTGLSNVKFTKISGFDEDPLTTKVDVMGELPYSEINGKYTADGSVLIIPIHGDGDAKVGFTDVKVRAQFQFDESKTIDGKLYVKLKKFKFSIYPKNVTMHFSNLFNGDKLLSDTTNIFLNENALDIYNDIKPTVVKAISVILEKTINQVYDFVPYADLFLNNA